MQLHVAWTSLTQNRREFKGGDEDREEVSPTSRTLAALLTVGRAARRAGSGARPMSKSKDIRAKAKVGRFFPLSHADVVRAVRSLSLRGQTGNRVRIRFINPSTEDSENLILAEFFPLEELRVYSLPGRVDQAISGRLLHSAVEAFAAIELPLPDPMDGLEPIRITYVARLGRSETTLRLFECRTTWQWPKYRGGDKFTHSRKPRNVRTRETEIPLDQQSGRPS